MFYHNGKPVHDENDVSVIKSAKMATLSIEYLRAGHQGNYTCRASNRAGQVEYSAELNINGYYLYFHLHELSLSFWYEIFQS